MKTATLKDGFQITVSFGTGESGTDYSASPNKLMLAIDPTSITPPGMDGLDPIDTTTHTNVSLRTKHPRALKDITDAAFTAVYDPGSWDIIFAAVNDNVEITFTFPDTSSMSFFGYLKDFKPNAFVEGEQATAECTFVATNYDHSDMSEVGPSYTAAA